MNNDQIFLSTTSVHCGGVLRDSFPFDVPVGYEFPAALSYLFGLYIVGSYFLPRTDFTASPACWGDLLSDWFCHTLQAMKNSF